MRLKNLFLLTAAVILFTSTQLFADAVFLKNGTILEGKITRDTDARITMKEKNGNIKQVPRNRVLRVLYHDDYKKPKYIGTKDGKVMRGYIVGESVDSYTIRRALNRKKELVIEKKDVLYVSAKKLLLVEDKKAPTADEEVKAEEKKTQGEVSGSLRLGARIQYFFGMNNGAANAEDTGHTFGASFFIHWKSFEFEFSISPKYNNKDLFYMSATAAWLPLSFYKFRLGPLLGYGQATDNLNAGEPIEGDKIYYYGLNYGIAFQFADWLRFNVCFGMIAEAETNFAAIPRRKNNLLPYSTTRAEVEFIFLKNYSIFVGHYYFKGDVGTLIPEFDIHYITAGIGYRFHL